MVDLEQKKIHLLMLCSADFGEEKANFFDSAARKVFPEMGIETSFLPDNLKNFPSKLFWIFKNRKKFDVMLGWQGWPVLLGFLRAVSFWKKPKLALLPYRLYDPNTGKLKLFFKHLLFRIASYGVDMMLALDSEQAKNYEKELKRRPGTTFSFQYGIDLEWYDSYREGLGEKKIKSKTVFSPGSAYRDEKTFIAAISDFNLEVFRFQLKGELHSSLRREGKTIIRDFYNQPYSKYVETCLESEIVVISVLSEDKPVGLTALLECVAYKKPVIITSGFSSNNYVKDGVTALLFKQGDYLDLRKKISTLLENRALREEISRNAYETLKKEYNLEKCGSGLGKLLYNLAIKN